MGQRIFVTLILVIGLSSPGVARELVTFKGENQETLTAKLIRPIGLGPFPALILVNGREWMQNHHNAWPKRLGGWGYVVLEMDFFGLQAKSSLHCLPAKRADVLCSTLSYLIGLPFVDSHRIGVMGWSLVGSSTLASYCKDLTDQKRKNPFRAVIVFYPYCFKPITTMDSPLLILAGALDDWSPPGLCQERIPPQKTKHEVILKIYSNAHHGFDAEGVNTKYKGYQLRYEPGAAADAIVQVKSFLAKHMK